MFTARIKVKTFKCLLPKSSRSRKIQDLVAGLGFILNTFEVFKKQFFSSELISFLSVYLFDFSPLLVGAEQEESIWM